ncbi:hypothetical protein AMS58_06025 [Pseudoalteromonas porphyrae]|uniref:Iron transporter n=2 Tax=Pseudoalteromonas TaxID=53246 RepID=A0A0N1MX11_9GAMM|nr:MULTISPECIES: hypothetical protein [Pseudoalteromonas]KPH65427.1 hypothetical protein ADS77_00340 [Pseudoalteromonas porphyrae]KPH95737.1 hypothetical protein AMS58_06025 [Pseudoalteromonas porphyrae]NMR26372.1 hypothetical protein [Pseudoalteromonas sp. NEC-BIFX-2020_015]NNG43272.1 hypothetical protein [Pseudoalteromonas sp. NEC-BIFX-2020_002]
MRIKKSNRIAPDWWTKTIAATLLGYLLALGLVGLFAWFGPGGIDAKSKVQFNVWLTPLIWLLIVSFSFLFKSGLRAFLWLSASNCVVYGALYLFK